MGNFSGGHTTTEETYFGIPILVLQFLGMVIQIVFLAIFTALKRSKIIKMFKCNKPKSDNHEMSQTVTINVGDEIVRKLARVESLLDNLTPVPSVMGSSNQESSL